jgi:hypothetical protein
MEKFIIDVLGWAGTILFLIAYGLVSAKKVEGDSMIYQGINIFAGAFLIINTWVGIAFFTLGRRWWKNK